MTVRDILMAASGSSGAANYIEDVFSTWLTTGTSSSLVVNNGIDLAGKGGLVWQKGRNSVVGATSHTLFDTARGVNQLLQTNSTSAQINASGTLPSFNSNGFEIGSNNNLYIDGQTGVSWTFRKQPKFFDVVTWSGDFVGGRQISHALGSVPGCIIIKTTSTTSNWTVVHRSLPAWDYFLRLNTADAADNAGGLTQAPTSTQFSATGYNDSGRTYVAYIFAHNAGGFGLTGTGNVISCGSFTTDGSGNATVNLGYEPQWVMYKRADGAGGWLMFDNMRGMTVNTTNGDAILFANLADAESTVDWIQPTSTGFNPYNIAWNATYIYIAIRRGPMKVPTSGTSVFNADFYRSANAVANNVQYYSGWPVDTAINMYRPGGVNRNTRSRLTGANYLAMNTTDAEVSGSADFFGSNLGYIHSTSGSNDTNIENCLFRRAPGFFDEVCDTGTGAAHTITHGLTVAPELIIRKKRTGTSEHNGWFVYSAALGATKYLKLESNYHESIATSVWNDTAPTASVFTVGTTYGNNESGATFVTYLFASCPGVSKVGSYTGTGTTQTINCGFTAGARFVLIKRTDYDGDWYVWDSARGIVAGNDPRLSLNTTAAEVTTDDSLDPASSGFIVNQVAATNINVTSATYIYLAIA